MLHSNLFQTRRGGGVHPSHEGRTFETWELLCFRVLIFLEKFTYKESSAYFFGH